MNYVGIDIGSTASKVVVEGDKKEHFVLPTGWSSKETCEKIKNKLLEMGIDVTSDDTKVVATGYGRIAVDFADHVITEITCHARGGRELAGGDCSIIDVGGQDTKVIVVQNGMVADFQMNDKCSAGTGKFLEIMANRLGVTINELFDMAAAGEVIPISSLCTVFAESEVINYGDKFDEAIIKYVRMKYKILIGEKTAEDLKVSVGSVFKDSRNISTSIKGRNLITGLPGEVLISTEELREALMEPVSMILESVKSVLEQTPPELAADIIERGILMTGGGALIDGLDKLIEDSTGIKVNVASNSIEAVALGTGEVLKYASKLDNEFTNKEITLID